jgi:hypothetical protein
MAGAIATLAGSIVAVNIAMMANPFGLIAAGIAITTAALVVAYNKFAWFRTGVNRELNNILTLVEGWANGWLMAINKISEGLNFLNPFGDPIPILTPIKIPRLGGGSGTGGGAGFADLTTENRGAIPIFNAPSITAPALPTSGGGGGGGGGGRTTVAAPTAPSFASPAIQSVLPDYFMADPTTQAAMNITINVDGGLATSADIGESVVNALRQYNQVQGPIPVAVA